MLKWIRWPGLIAFVALFGGLFVFSYFFAGMLVKNAIEDYGSEALGAQVNVDSVSLTVDPLGFRVGRVQATNSNAPMTNAVDIKAMAFEVSFWNLFMGQFIINEMSVDGIKFNTAREKSGALPKKSKKQIEKESKPSILDTAKKQLPTVKDILAKETLLTDVLSEELKTLYAERIREIDELKANLADGDKLKAYQAEIKEITSGKLKSLDDYKNRKARLSEITSEIKNEKEKISEAKRAYSSAYTDLKEKLKEVKAAPSKDLKNLRNKYSLDGGGAANVSKLLFGDKAGEWTAKTLTWYEKAKPYLESAEKEKKVKVIRKTGRFVHFGGIEALPEFLLREARLDIVLPAGHLDGRLQDVTHQPEILRRPTLLNVNGNELNGYDSINLKAEFNHIDSKNSFDRADLKINAMEVNNFSVSSDKSFNLKLSKAMTDISGTAIIKNKKLDLNVNAAFTNVQFKSKASSGIAKQVGELLETIHQFTITIMAKGNLKDLDTSFDSSLDEQLKVAMNAKIDAKQAKLEAELKQKLQAKLAENTGKYASDIEALLRDEKSMDTKLNELEGLAKSKLDTWEDQQKAELEAKKEAEKAKAKNKIEDKLKDKLKGFKF
jgi:uncharacterized protein (TIGR03545 family)